MNRRVTLLVVIGAVVGTLLGLAVAAAPVLPDVAGEQAARTDQLYKVMVVVMGAILGIVTAVLVYSVVAFRLRHGEDRVGAPTHGHTGLEIVWTAIPTVIVVALTAYSWIVLNDNEKAKAATKPEQRLEVGVNGFQWSWKYYLPADGVPDDVESDDLLLPINRPVRFTVRSKDVIHGFWIPDLRIQMNTVPGDTNYVYATPTKLGELEVVCTFICGNEHPQMGTEVAGANPKRIRVVTQEEFDAWLATRQQEAKDFAANPNAGVVKIFNANGCSGCHAWKVAGSTAQTGPALDDLSADAKADGKDLADFVRESIVEPNATIAPNFPSGVMPSGYEEKIPGPDLDKLVEALAGGAQ